MSDSNDVVAFPRLDQRELERLEEIATRRSFAQGDVLIAAGTRDYPFFAVCSGAVLITESSRGSPEKVTTHRRHGFAGDVDLLTGRPALVTATAIGPTEVLEVPAAAVRRMLNEIPGLGEKLLLAFQARRELLERAGFVGIRILGTSDSREALELREFCYKNKVPHRFEDVDEPDGRAALEELGRSRDELPLIHCGARVEPRPSLAAFAECLGISRAIPEEIFDLTVVGAGPAGLAAAVYAGSEGLRTLLVDRVGPGGQTGQSSMIENYMGFPAGLSGTELANRAYLQALKFGVEFRAPISVRAIEDDRGELVLKLCTDQTVRSRAVLLATGAAYRRLPVEHADRWEGKGVFYAATTVESRVCRGGTAVVVGGGNSAGQAALFLSQHAERVKLVIRGDDLGRSMSHYLVHRIERARDIDVLLESEIVALEGDRRLERVEILDRRSGRSERLECAGVFVFIGARPHTEWLAEGFARDSHGFLRTGAAVAIDPRWPGEREPCELETTHPGVFAAGDVRSGTTKRCAFAAGDGALAVTCVHAFLEERA